MTFARDRAAGVTSSSTRRIAGDDAKIGSSSCAFTVAGVSGFSDKLKVVESTLALS
jgi:hypothetical protein